MNKYLNNKKRAVRVRKKLKKVSFDRYPLKNFIHYDEWSNT